MRARRGVLAAAGAVVLAAPLSVLWLIVRCGVNVPVEDQIDIGAFLVRNHGRLFPAFADLIAQHNESRKFFPRLVFFYLARLTHWNVKYEMGVSLVIACATLAAMFVLARRTLGDRALPATAIAALLLFSLVQWWNWLFGIQIVAFIPMLMLTTALVAAGSARSLPQRMGIAAACCVIAMYSYANGMALWVLVDIALFVRREAPSTGGQAILPVRTGKYLTAWCVLAIAMIAAYFAGYERPPVSPALESPLSHPFAATRFILAFLGHPVSWTGDVTTCAWLGAAGLVAFVIAIYRKRLQALPWLLVASYSFLSAIAAAVGRLGFGDAAAVEPRYTTFAIPFWIALVMLVAQAGLPVLHVAVAGLSIFASIGALPDIRAAYRDRLVAKTAMQFSTVLPDTTLFRRLIYRDPQRAIPIVSELSRIGYIQPPLIPSPIIRGSGTAAGAMEGVMRVGPSQWVMYGWAASFDAVLVTRDDSVIAISERTIGRADRPGPGWDLPLTQQFAIPGAIFNAYAYDTAAQRAYRLAGSVRIGSR